MTKQDQIADLVEFVRLQLEDKKGKDIAVLPVAEKTVLADYFILASGSSVPQVRALAGQVQEKLKKEKGIQPAHIEGEESGRWILLDYLDFVVHVFHEEERSFYSLEKLWSMSGKKAVAEKDII